MENILEMYRIQGPERNVPGKRCPKRSVVINDDGRITFNPNTRQVVYFSRTKTHQAYYIYNRVIRIITDELRKVKQDPCFGKLDVPVDFLAYRDYRSISYEAIKQVKSFFYNYLPPKDVELVTLQYLNAFGQLVDKCAVNTDARGIGNSYPEKADPTMFGGAYGLNDAWLELLKQCTVASKRASVPITRLLDEIVNCKHLIEIQSREMDLSLLDHHQMFFQTLENVTRRELKNPEFFDRNATNSITNLLGLIEEHKMYPPQLDIGKTFFADQRKQFKDEHREQIDLLR